MNQVLFLSERHYLTKSRRQLLGNYTLPIFMTSDATHLHVEHPSDKVKSVGMEEVKKKQQRKNKKRKMLKKVEVKEKEKRKNQKNLLDQAELEK